MILVTHAVGGAVASLLFKTHPVLGFFAGFASHFVLDAVPHSVYHLNSIVKNDEDPITHTRMVMNDRRFLVDILKIGTDFGAGVLVSGLAAFHVDSSLATGIIAGGLGGMAPDLLHFFYYLFPASPLRHIEKFHLWIHRGPPYHIQNNPVLGVVSQLLIFIAFAAILCFA